MKAKISLETHGARKGGRLVHVGSVTGGFKEGVAWQIAGWVQPLYGEKTTRRIHRSAQGHCLGEADADCRNRISGMDA
ncbi:hypothetical protein [Rhizobium sp. 007]|uniref:hypothetical protein n=1 Tax=Rhizobium sp. 007 TaxID=2785056 RepID=UPI00188FEE49|nr:hypothetical protein [Rhizobium sp. 007]QPB22474.1 hypothetical protein ISN39_22970 [Rhizobium sp. 007]